MVIPPPSIRGSRLARVLLVGNVVYADTVAAAMPWALRPDGEPRDDQLSELARLYRPDLIVVAGWRHLLPRSVLRLAPTVGFHSAKLPEYPGRAPVPWTFLRGDTHAWNTMLYLDEGIDTGDVVDARALELRPNDTPDSVYRWIGESSVEMLALHLTGLLSGTAPRLPQDFSRRGPVTTKDGWQLYGLR